MKLIDKDAALEEIKKLEKLYCYDSVTTGGCVAKSVFISINDVFKSLEVKEVDLEHLEQEVKDFCYEYDDRKEKWYELCPNDRKLLYNPTWANFAMSIAKHFFELGLKIQKGE